MSGEIVPGALTFRRLPASALLCASALLAACAHALKEPPALQAVVGNAEGRSPRDVDELLAQAEALFARYDFASVRKAAEAWSAAAAADPRRIEGLAGIVKANVWVTEHETDPAARLAAAEKGVHAAQWCQRTAPREPVCDYWLGAALGVQARERPSTGISALPKIEAAFKEAGAARPEIEDGGPDRALALLYLRAPAWPAGPGDPALALEHAQKAAELKPDYPPNHLALGEVRAATGDGEGSRRAYARARDLARIRASAGDPEAKEWMESAEKALAKYADPRPE